MGLIDDIREKRDSWVARFEEHRKKDENDCYYNEEDIGEEEILKNRMMVGQIPRKGDKD